jgi:hypothetical protein
MPNLKTATVSISENDYHWIAEAAYYKALARGFAPENAEQDWLAAIDDFLKLHQKLPKNGLIRLPINAGIAA